MGSSVPIHATPFQIYDGFLTKVEVNAAVYQLRMNRSGIHTHLQANHFKTWQRDTYLAKEDPPPPK